MRDNDYVADSVTRSLTARLREMQTKGATRAQAIAALEITDPAEIARYGAGWVEDHNSLVARVAADVFPEPAKPSGTCLTVLARKIRRVVATITRIAKTIHHTTATYRNITTTRTPRHAHTTEMRTP